MIETTALGAVYLAGLASGVWRDADDIASLWQVDRRFEPGLSDVEPEPEPDETTPGELVDPLKRIPIHQPAETTTTSVTRTILRLGCFKPRLLLHQL